MNLNTTTGTGTDAISQLISKVMDKYDGNKDGQLTKAEFGSFLTGLLGVSVPGTLAKDPEVQTGAYRSRLAGFAFAKLDHPTMPGGGTSK